MEEEEEEDQMRKKMTKNELKKGRTRGTKESLKIDRETAIIGESLGREIRQRPHPVCLKTFPPHPTKLEDTSGTETAKESILTVFEPSPFQLPILRLTAKQSCTVIS